MNKNSKIYIAGHTGLVGSSIIRNIEAKGYSNFVFTPFPDYDLRNQQEVESFFKKEKPEYVFLSAAKDSEFALATEKGSVFTLGLNSIIESALISKRKLTPQELHAEITDFMQHKIQSENIPGDVHHPQLSVSTTLKNENIIKAKNVI